MRSGGGAVGLVVLALAATTVHGYFTCTSGVHEWMRFHDFVTDEQEDFLALLKAQLHPAYYSDGTADARRLNIPNGKLLSNFHEWWGKVGFNRFADDLKDPTMKWWSGQLSSKFTSQNDNMVKNTYPAGTNKAWWDEKYGYTTNLDFCEDVVKGMSLGFHSGCGKEWQYTNCISDDDGWMYGERGNDGCPYEVEFKIHDMFARGVAMLVCARYTYWDTGMVWSDDPKSATYEINEETGTPYQTRSRPYGVSGGSFWKGVGMAMSASWNPFTGFGAVKGSIAQGAYGDECDGDLRNEMAVMEPSPPSTPALCWQFVKDIHDLSCRYNNDNYNLVGGVSDILKWINKYHLDVTPLPDGTVDVAVTMPPSVKKQLNNDGFGQLVQKLKERDNKADILPTYADMGPKAVWPGWGKTEAACNKQQRMISEQNTDGIVDMLVGSGDTRSGATAARAELLEKEWTMESPSDADYVITRESGTGRLPHPDTRWALGDVPQGATDQLKTEPFVLIENGYYQNPTVIPEPVKGGGGSSGSSSGSSDASSKSSKFVSYYSKYKSYMALDYSQQKKENAIRWLEQKIGEGAADTLQFFGSFLDALHFGMEQGLVDAANRHGLCTREGLSKFVADRKCMCEVVEPILNAIEEAESETLHEARPDSGAITLMYSKSIGGHASLVGGDAAGGLYVTVQWSPHWRFDIGGHANLGHSISLGSDVISTGAHVGFKLGVFFGRQDEISAYRKGIDFGVALGAKVSIHLEVLFLDEFMGMDGGEVKRLCQPLFQGNGSVAARAGGHALRMLTFPVHPKCINGFAVGVNAGISADVTVGSFNVYTSHSIGTQMSLAAYDQISGPELATISLREVGEIGEAAHDTGLMDNHTFGARNHGLEQDAARIEMDLQLMEQDIGLTPNNNKHMKKIPSSHMPKSSRLAGSTEL